VKNTGAKLPNYAPSDNDSQSGVRPSTVRRVSSVRSTDVNSRIDALENAPCTAQRPHRLSNLFGHIRIHSLLRTAAVVAVVALTGMFAWRTVLMPAPITYFNADTTIMHVAMPDGSDIWLTPGSTLCYDETFHTDKRRVHLDGEAYFDVEHDAEHPFDVVTPNLRVRVLGTVFSVRS
jgi:Fe2+-dicitrate sensor, membrane component